MKFFMKFFRPKYSVCSECGVHFEPVTGYEAKFVNLCSIHRKPVMEIEQKKNDVMLWASVNWERLYVMMEKEKEKKKSEFNKLSQDQMAYLADCQRNAYSNAQQQRNISGIFGNSILGSLFK